MRSHMYACKTLYNTDKRGQRPKTSAGTVLSTLTRNKDNLLDKFKARMEKYPNGTTMPNLATQVLTGKTSQLSPLFVEEMMGFPKGWTVSPFQSGDENP